MASEGGNIIRIIGGKSEWISEKDFNIIATDGDVSLSSPTKVNIEGLQGGQKFGVYDYIKDPFIGNAFIPIVLIDDSTNNDYEVIKQKEQWDEWDENLDEEYKKPKINDIKFKVSDKKKIKIKFQLKKGNRKANDSDGGNISVSLFDKNKKLITKNLLIKDIKYGESFEFEWDRTKGISQIQFYADDNDKYFDGGVSNVRCGVYKLYIEEDKECGCNKYKIEEGLLKGPNVIHTKSGNKVKPSGTMKLVKAIVLHRTAGYTTSGAIGHSKGTHFYVDGPRGKDGEIFQPFALDKSSSHIRSSSDKTRISRKDIENNNSIGIEVIGMNYSKDKKGNWKNEPSKDKKITKGYTDNDGKHHWDQLSENQILSVICIVKILMQKYNLSKSDILVHEEIQQKTGGEGMAVYDAIKSKL